MHSSYLLSAILAAGAIAIPAIHHNHMDLHQHQHKERDTEQFNEALTIFSNLDQTQKKGGATPNEAQQQPAPQQPAPQQPAPQQPAPQQPAPQQPAPQQPAPQQPAPQPQVPANPPTTISAPPPPQEPTTSSSAAPQVKQEDTAPQAKQLNAIQSQTPTSAAPAISSPPTNAGDAVSAPTATVANLDPSSQQYQTLALAHHNVHRQNHSVPLLQWDSELASQAAQLSQKCFYQHDLSTCGGSGVCGQNIGAGNPAGAVGATLTNGWYNNEFTPYSQASGHFSSDSPDMSQFGEWGHLTQMLWKDTTSVGCFTYSCNPSDPSSLKCGSNGQNYLKNDPTGAEEPLYCDPAPSGKAPTAPFFTVCNYKPAGNWPSKYLNVPGPSNGMAPTVNEG